MKNTHCVFRAIFLSLWLLCGAGLALAQGTNLGTIRGTVTDPNGSVVANAKVQVTDLETNLSRDFTTDKEGNYEAAGLKSGNYRISVSATGFKTSVTDAALRGGDTTRVDITATIGAATETVTITGAEGQLIERETPTISGSLNNRQLIDIPRDSRDIYSFLYLNPDITQGANGDGSFKFIGGQTYGAAFSLDGQRSNGGIFGEPTQSQPSLETIGELTVLSKNFTAEYSGIANIRVETKRGTKDVNGSLFYNNKNSALAAWNVQDKAAQASFLPTLDAPNFRAPSFNLNEAGGSVGGPVPFSGKKTFYLLSYERRWDFAPLQIRATNVPSTPLLSGDFRGISNSSKPAVPAAVLPLLTPQELANNTILTGPAGAMTRRFITIPQRLLNPVALNVLDYYPRTNPATPFNATNGRLTNYVQNVPSLLTRDLATLRLDHDISGKDKIAAVYNYQVKNGIRGLVLSPFEDFGRSSQHQNNHTLSLSYTRIFSDRVVNELRGGFNYQLVFRRANQRTSDFLAGIGFNQQEIAAYGSVLGDVLDTYGHVAFTMSPFLNIANGGRNTDRNQDQKLYTFGDTLTWITGNHSFKFGGDFVLNRATDGFSANRGNPRGLVNYGTNFDAYARFLIGLPPTSVTYLGSTRRGDLKTSNWENGFFVQDDWKIHRKVTLNLGLRYDLITPFIEDNDLMINFDPANSVNSGFKGRFIIPSDKTKALLDPRFLAYGVVTADEAGVGRGLVKTDKNNFAPRLGAAWRLTESDVLRGGYGMFYPTSAAQGMRDALATNGFNQGVTRRNTLGLPGGINPRGITPFSGGTVSVGDPNDFGSLAANAIPIDLQSPRIEQFNVTYERELGWDFGVRVSYVGSRQHGLIVGSDLNMLQPNNTPFGILNEDGDRCDPLEGDCALSPADAARRPFPRLGSFLAIYGNGGSGRSHALQVEANRRFAKGLMLSVSYTLLDQKSSGNDSGNSTLGGTLYNQFIINNDFSRDSFVSRHRLVAYGMYELPIGRKRDYGKTLSPLGDAFVGGWDLTWNMFAKSGTGFTPYWQCDNCSDVVGLGNIGSDFLDAVGGFATGATYRPLVIGDPYAGLSGNQFFNSNAFALPPTGADLLDNPAVARRNFLTGPGSWGVNLGVHKNFAVTERIRLQVGADFNNVFNHPLWSPVGPEIGQLGNFLVSLDPQGKSVILPENVFINPDFGRNTVSTPQEGIDSRRSIRIRLRLSF
jgi:hypothetical protein